MLKIDFHLHSAEDPVDRIGHDAVMLIDRAAALGFQAIAITLHERQLNDDRVHAHARERGIVLLPGIERTVEGRHVLLIGFPQVTESLVTFDELAALKRRSGGLVIAPHPFFPGGSCLGADLERHAALFDAVEWSYFWTRLANFNARAQRWAEARGVPLVGNSDLHDIRQLGRTFSLVDADPDPAAICEAIREHRVTLYTEPVPAWELASVLGGMFKRARMCPKKVCGIATGALATE